MKIHKRCPVFRGRNILIISVISGILIWVFAVFLGIVTERVQANPSFDLSSNPLENSATIQENSFLTVSSVSLPIKPVQKVQMVITGYSSTVWETDETPYVTASGSGVKEGVVANNLLPFGTKVRIPEIYGDRIFVVEDRMHRRKSYYQLDIWFPDYSEAKNFGVKKAFVEILEN